MHRWRYKFWWLVTREWFDGLMLLVVVINLIPVLWEFIREVSNSEASSCISGDEKDGINLKLAFEVLNYIFTTIYTLEIIMKVSQ